MRAARVGVVSAVLTAVIVLLAAADARALVGGREDGAAHPYVGAIDARPVGAPIFTSGVLVSSTVFLTAGHTTRFFERAGLSRARVTFAPSASDASRWHEGTVHTNPAYDPSHAPDPGDLGVIVFDEPVPGVAPASLPPAGLLDRPGARQPSRAGLTVVGYGVSRYLGGSQRGGTPHPDLGSTGTRRSAPQTFASSTSAWLRLRMQGGAEVCIGDSGAPSLLADSDVVAGITIGESSLSGGQCESEPWDMRVDTPSARRFLAAYVALP